MSITMADCSGGGPVATPLLEPPLEQAASAIAGMPAARQYRSLLMSRMVLPHCRALLVLPSSFGRDGPRVAGGKGSLGMRVMNSVRESGRFAANWANLDMAWLAAQDTVLARSARSGCVLRASTVPTWLRP